MPIAFRCPKCQKKLHAPESMAGKRVKCPHCSQVLVLPEPVLQAKPVHQVEEQFDDLSRSDPFDAPAANPPAGNLGTGALFCAEQFDEMLADTCPRVNVKRPEPQEDRYPCPACQELIVRGATKCRFCGEELGRRPKKKGPISPGLVWKFRIGMIVLGVWWLFCGVLTGAFLVRFMLVTGPKVSHAADPHATSYFVGILVVGFIVVVIQ